MLWLYGVAWHQPMADSIDWARATIADALPVATSYRRARRQDRQPVVAGPGIDRRRRVAAARHRRSDRRQVVREPGVRRFGQRRPRRRRAVRRAPGARSKRSRPKVRACSRAGNWRRAAELCREWTDLDLANADAWRCLGQAQQAQGNHQEALDAFRKAKQYDPNDRSLDAAIDRAQRGIIAEFTAKYRNNRSRAHRVSPSAFRQIRAQRGLGALMPRRKSTAAA